jgi:hypothetical protein
MIHKGVSEVTSRHLYSTIWSLYMTIVHEAVICTVHYFRLIDIAIYQICTKRDILPTVEREVQKFGWKYGGCEV